MDWVESRIQQAKREGWTTLNLNGTDVRDVSVLSSLANLTSLDLSGTDVSDVSVLSGLTNLTFLNLCDTDVSDVSALSSLVNLASLNLSFTRVSDVSSLGSLVNLTSLGLMGTPLSDVSALSSLVNLTSLGVSSPLVSDVSALSSLVNLTSLDFMGAQVSDVSALSSLVNLTSLNLIDTQVSDVSALSSLVNLTKLNLIGAQVSDVSALSSLVNLTTLNLSETLISLFPDFILLFPNLRELYLYGCPINNVPVEILGSAEADNCLDAVRSHFADKAHGVALDRVLKLILLGNGRVGKTSIAKRLVDNDFDPSEPSTHGIQLVPWKLPSHEDEALRLNIWDFGGQDIYHGTHGLFLRSRALFLLVWDRVSEHQPGYEEEGQFFEHFPLAYWLDYVRDTSRESPVLVIENKCDDGRGSQAPVAVTGSHLIFSAKEDIGREAVTGWIRETSRRELANLGARQIGVGRWRVKQTLLDYMAQDEGRKPAERQYRTLSYADFQALCDAQQGQVSSARELLRYLHHTGVVYYQEGLFNDQIILDQRWVIEAIYTIFHREKSYRQLKRRGGRFRPSDLHDLAWEDRFTEDEQKLFITFMESCALCFRLSRTSMRMMTIPSTSPPNYCRPWMTIAWSWIHGVRNTAMTRCITAIRSAFCTRA